MDMSIYNGMLAALDAGRQERAQGIAGLAGAASSVMGGIADKNAYARDVQTKKDFYNMQRDDQMVDNTQAMEQKERAAIGRMTGTASELEGQLMALEGGNQMQAWIDMNRPDDANTDQNEWAAYIGKLRSQVLMQQRDRGIAVQPDYMNQFERGNYGR